MTAYATPTTDPAHAPVAPREAHVTELHGDTRHDDYFWLRRRKDPRVLQHLKAENAYSQAWFKPHRPLIDQLYAEMVARVAPSDETAPVRRGAWWYSSRTLAGQQYAVMLRRPAVGAERRLDMAAPPQVMLDLNRMARNQPFLALGAQAVSPDAKRLAYTVDLSGGLDYTLSVKTLGPGGRTLPWHVAEVEDVAWGNDSRTLYYVTMDAAKRASRLWRHVIGRRGADELLYEEHDALYSVGIGKTLDQRYIVLDADSADATEIRVIDADDPRAVPRLVFARRPQVQATLEHRHGQFYLRLNDTGRNFRLVRVDAAQPDLAAAEELLAARDDVMLDEVDLFERYLVVAERDAGRQQLHVFDLDRIDAFRSPTSAARSPQGSSGPAKPELLEADHLIAFDEPTYSVGASGNAEFDSGTLRFTYESLTTPVSVYDYDMATRERRLVKRQPVPGGYDPSAYASERLMATAGDGTRVPISLVYRRDLRAASGPGPQPLLLYGYGSYGIPTDPTFSSARLSLLDRGVAFAIAHVRGGGELGRTWYEAGKMGRKMNTFTDFIACAQALIERGYTEPARLAIQGGSAGGLLMGAVTNLRPDLFRAVVAQVPFVDVINTMLDESLPLTTGEFIEWGNPKIAEQYAWMRAYSPYDNLKPGAYPAIYVHTGLNDSQVAYWEPAKYVARLRTLKTDDRPLLLQVDLARGHRGASGRFDRLRETAETDAFVLVELGLPSAAPTALPASHTAAH